MKEPNIPIDQARSGFTVTPSDTLNLHDDPNNTRYKWSAAVIRIGTGGDLKVTMLDDDDDKPIVFKNLQDGEYIPGLVKKVWATGQGGTIASNIIALAK